MAAPAAPARNCAPNDPLCNAGRAASASCDPPYYFDATGQRVFKKECL